MDVLLGLNHDYAYLKDKPPVPVRDLPHDPWFWAIPEEGEDASAARQRVVDAWQRAKTELGAQAGDDVHPLQKIKAVGPVKTVNSFHNFGRQRPAFPVYTTRSHFVPDVSTELFAHHRLFTAEHDVPYQQRAVVDLASGAFEDADGQRAPHLWPYDTGGKEVKLRVLVYDIETTQWEATRKGPTPIDMIGWAEFEVAYKASKDLENEEFHIHFTKEPPAWQDVKVHQDEAHDAAEEARLLMQFVRRVPSYDVISGHNILSFDNKEIYERIQSLIGRDSVHNLTGQERRVFEEFTTKYAIKDRTFTFGQQNETVNFHPTSLDTYHAARRFYFFLDSFTLKRLAPFMGVDVPDRVYLQPNELKLGDEKTRDYNIHDVQEQLGVTMKLLAQALPLAFTAGWTFEELLTAGNVRMWDHMGMIRAARQRKMMPATCRARGIAGNVLRELGPSPSKQQIWEHARERAKDPESVQRLKEFIRVAKYGDEMPDWLEVPTVIVNPKAYTDDGKRDEAEEALGYSIPGGMTLHPQDLGSHFIPWWHVITADVGAMYPTILRARNVSADTVRLARSDEEPDDWIWMYRVDDDFLKGGRWKTREPSAKETYVGDERGILVGIKKNPDPGVTSQAMKGVMGIAARVKKQLAEAKDTGMAKGEHEQLKMMYASLKANRNAGTHGQMLAVNVSCRGFNLWAGAEITTVGQKILADVRGMLEERGARIVYGDTDGIYIGCSKTGKNFPEVAEALGDTYEPGGKDSWYILPDDATKAVEHANEQIRAYLKYPEFELEAEHHDAMVFVVHKNYLIFDARNGRLEMFTKGNNFRGSDKAPIAQRLLGDIMRAALKETISWQEEEQAREALQAAIKRNTREVWNKFDVQNVDPSDLTLVQVVQPVRAYKTNPDGSDSIWMKRARALQKVTGEELRASKKYRFVVCKQPLPGIEKPSKTGLKPLDFMWPVDNVENGEAEIDLDWYKDMIEKYIRGAFGFQDLELHTQKGLDAWM